MSSGPVLMISILVAFSVQDATATTSVVNRTVTTSPTATASTPIPISTSAVKLGPTATALASAPTSTSAAPTPTPSTTTGGSSTSVTPTGSSFKKTCGSIKVTLKTPNGEMKKTAADFKEAIESFFDDSQKYKDVEVSDLELGDPEEETFKLTFKLCMAYISANGSIEDVLLQHVKDGKLLNISIADGENSFTFEASGVKFSNWKVKDGECKKCSDGGAGPIEFKRECKPEPGYSCKGLNNTKIEKGCVTYCKADGSSAVSIMISTLVMAMGISLFLSYNIWE